MNQVVQQSAVLAGRTFQHWRVQPGPFIVNLLFPVLVLVMMGGLLGGALAGDLESYFAFAVPGVLAVAMLFGLESTMLAITTDASSTITDRFRSLPISGWAVPAGRCLADMAASVLGLAVTIAAGVVLGWRPNTMIGVAVAAGVLLWFRFGLLWLGLYAGLKARSPQAVAAVQILVWPISMVSSVFVDPSTMPAWLAVIAEWNPLSFVVTSVRELTNSPTYEPVTWAGAHALPLAVVTPLLVVAIFGPLAVRRYRKLAS